MDQRWCQWTKIYAFYKFFCDDNQFEKNRLGLVSSYLVKRRLGTGI